ncbi:MAG: ABC transporter permease, partial [Oscillospiraceae bacterium]|nr:ABC transporter permease [Oscillospiraceae bacterium]
MVKRLYPKLAVQNIVKNGKFYFPYILTVIFTSAAFYIMLALNSTRDLPDMNRYSNLSVFVGIGTVVVGLFSVIFLFYSNSFLMKRRSKELGLYNILGMGKGHIARVLIIESFITAVLGIGLGICCGMLLQKLVTMLLYKLMRFDLYYTFSPSVPGMALTAVIFGAILVLNLIFNLFRIHLQKPIELLHGSGAGEKEPKTKWILAVIGVLALFAGYYIAVVTKDAVTALELYFVAVFAVIIGTYCLFTAVSVAVLKLLRRNKGFYYKTSHFIGISGMLYRMKRNAVGLANICILSTIVLVMVSGTLSLFLGAEDAIDTNYPADIIAEVGYTPSEGGFDSKEATEMIAQKITERGLELTNVRSYISTSFGAGYADQRFNTLIGYGDTQAILTFIPAEGYASLTGEEKPELSPDEVLLWSDSDIGDRLELVFSGQTGTVLSTRGFTVVQRLKNTPNVGIQSFAGMIRVCAVVSDSTVIDELFACQREAYDVYQAGDASDSGVYMLNFASYVYYKGLFDTDASDEENTQCVQSINETLPTELSAAGRWDYLDSTSRAVEALDYYSLNGGFFFLGTFLGILFIM